MEEDTEGKKVEDTVVVEEIGKSNFSNKFTKATGNNLSSFFFDLTTPSPKHYLYIVLTIKHFIMKNHYRHPHASSILPLDILCKIEINMEFIF